jgi:peptide/nickel transport system substrate-binding protein
VNRDRSAPFTWCRSGLIAITIGLAVLASACPWVKAGRSDQGGTLTVAAWEPDCADPLLQCSINPWGGAYPSMTLQTLPRVVDSSNGRYVPSVLLERAPSLDPGPPQRVTYHINPKAVWSDGQPITSSDFRFTWSEIVHEKDVVDPTGYGQIQNVDDSDPRTAVVTFTTPFADWQDLFGQYYGVLPKHLLEGRDRNAEMKDGYGWSGAPWLIQSWTKGRSIVLVPNRRYWGERPKLDRVVFTFVTDDSSEEQAYRSGQAQVVTPVGWSSRTDLRTVPDTNFAITPSLNYEEITFNTERPPLDDKAVRQALAYATDRTAIAKAVFTLEPQSAPIDSFLTPASPFYVDPFRQYQRNLQKVDELMGSDGWARGPDGIWTRRGQRATVQFTTMDQFPVGRAEIEGNMLKAQWHEAGFDITATATAPDVLFGDLAPNGTFSTISYLTLPLTFSPWDCPYRCSENIPPAGQAWSRLRSPTIDDLYHKIGTELDNARRHALVAQVQQALADEVPGLPLAAAPTVIYWRTTVGGPIGANDPFGPFMNLNQWYCKGGQCST